MIKTFHDLEVWKKAHRLALKVFDLTEDSRSSHRYDLLPQLRRAALSIPTNIAEGCATPHTRELLQFINIAQRSASETQYLLLFAKERHVITEEQFGELSEQCREVERMLHGLTKSLKRGSSRITSHVQAVTDHRSLVTDHRPPVTGH